MPVARKDIELDDGSIITVRQVSGKKKLKLEARQAKVFRDYRHFGEPTDWTTEQHEEFADALDEAGAGLQAQVDEWLEDCIVSEGIEIDDLTSAELLEVLSFVRGDLEIDEDTDTEEGHSVPLEPSQE
tara:strand:- start:107 stop:490 length:384 start_codon:yes stop_codon:yes gene_type:complete